MHKVNINVLKVSNDGGASVRTIEPDSRISIEEKETIIKEEIWLILKGDHYDTLAKKDSPLVLEEQNILKVTEEKEYVEVIETDNEQLESSKDKTIKKLKAELKKTN